jgi:hypothetical protein
MMQGVSAGVGVEFLLHVTTHYKGTESSAIDIEAFSHACLSFSDRVLIKCRVQESPSCVRFVFLSFPRVFFQHGLCSSASCIYFFQHCCLPSQAAVLSVSLSSSIEQSPLGQVASSMRLVRTPGFRRRSSKGSRRSSSISTFVRLAGTFCLFVEIVDSFSILFFCYRFGELLFIIFLSFSFSCLGVGLIDSKQVSYSSGYSCISHSLHSGLHGK